MIKNRDSNSLKPYCLYLFVSSFVLTRGVFLLYLSSVGLNVFQLATYQSIYSISTAILEIPTGFLGDKIGKKKSVMIGTLLLAIHATLMYWNNLIFIFLLLAFLEALAYSFISGSDSALLYEILEHSNLEHNYLRVNSIIMSICSGITGLALILGAFLAEISWCYVYLITAGVFILALLTLTFVKDIKFSVCKEKNSKNNLKLLRKQFLYPLATVFIIFIFVSSACDGLFMCYYNLNQIILPKFDLPTKYIGLFFSALYFINSVAYIIVNLLTRIFNRKQIFIIFLSIESILFFSLSLSDNLGVVVTISAFICFCPEIIFSVSDSIIQQYICSQYRATILSIVSLIRSLISSVMYIVLGYLINTIEFKAILIYISFTICIVALASIAVKSKISRKLM